MPLLVRPNIKFEQSYRSLIKEFSKEKIVPFTLEYPHDDFTSLIARLYDNSIGIGIPEGFVANSSFWLTDENNEIVGVSNLRHNLTDNLRTIGGHIGFGIRPSARAKGYGSLILQLTLAEALQMGISKVLVTCDKNNIASAKIITTNGGVFESEDYSEEQNDVVQRYWINLTGRKII